MCTSITPHLRRAEGGRSETGRDAEREGESARSRKHDERKNRKHQQREVDEEKEKTIRKCFQG